MAPKQQPEQHTPIRAWQLLLWYALATGVMQFIVWLVAKHVVRRAVFIDRQIVWSTTVANLVVFGTALLLWLAASRLLPRLRTRSALVVLLTVLAGYTILLMVPRIHWIALLALALGAGVQLGRRLAQWAAFDGIVRRTAVPLGLFVLLGAAVANVRPAVSERNALRRAGAARADAPNVLFIIWDTVRAASLGLYGYERDTSPFLTRFAERGVTFEHAFATAPWTLASHGGFFTGRYPYELSASWDIPLDDEYATLAEELSANGYATGAFVANHIFSPPEFGLARGFAHYEGRPVSLGSVLGASPIVNQLYSRYERVRDVHFVPEERSADNISRRFWRWRERVGVRPYFAFLNYFDAHEPYTPPAPYDTLFGKPRVRKVINDRRPTAAEVADVRDAYDGAIAYLDDRLRQLIDELERRGELDRTLIIIASDHGEHIGEHGLLDHGNTLYAPLLHVPLVMVYPQRLPARERVAPAISLRDLPQTILELTGVRPRNDFPGRPLTRLWQDGPDPAAADTVLAQVPWAPGQPDWYPLAAGDIRSVLLWPLQLIVDGAGREEIYDLAADPLGLQNIAPTLSQDRLAQLRAALAAFPSHVRRTERQDR